MLKDSMKTKIATTSTFIVATLMLAGFASMQSQTLDRKQLREILVQLGYEVKDIVKDEGKQKYAVSFSSNDLNLPVGYEISPSGNYIWLTANLGDGPKAGNEMTFQLLKQNARVQPTFFYISESGKLMAALAVENRGVTNSLLKQRSEIFADNVGKTKDVWLK